MIKTWIIIQCSFLNFFLFLSFSPSSSLLILPELHGLLILYILADKGGYFQKLS